MNLQAEDCGSVAPTADSFAVGQTGSKITPQAHIPLQGSTPRRPLRPQPLAAWLNTSDATE